MGAIREPTLGLVEVVVYKLATFQKLQATGAQARPVGRVPLSPVKLRPQEPLGPMGATPRADYTVFLPLLDEHGQLMAQGDAPPAPGTYPTSLWEPGEVIPDGHTLRPSAGQRPGTYRLRLRPYDPATGRRLPVVGAGEDGATIATLEVRP